ncbi:unnamed protein product [Urochloa decumbens]|uniref:Uncharacterized protein n=1 Tax=Urochloa decumbens TaxID=240449 RepID=A0ABC9GWN8_9POAL
MDTEKQLRFIEEMTTDVDAVQERVLQEILSRNADAEYLATKCGLAGATDRATFRAKVPMVEYEDLVPYIRRIADGDRSPILTGPEHPVTEFFTSSGTSGGERKLIPAVEDEFDRRGQLSGLAKPVIHQYVPGLDEGSGLYFHFIKSETKTPGGLPARTVLTSLFKSDFFHKFPPGAFTSPVAAILCEDAFQSMYAQLLCGLCQRRRVVRVGAVFASGLLRAIHFLQRNWEQLAADIDSGTLTSRVTDSSVRDAVAGVLRPDPELAQFIRAEGSNNGDGAGIIARIWPNTKYLDTVVTGSMAQYVPTLNYYSGGLPIVSMMYASSECSIGLNLRPMCDPSDVSYTIMPNMAYVEFLPVDAEGTATASQLVELANVEVGREYELVVTTYAGLCRYRVGDVLRVTGFHNAAPEFRFVRRSNVVLSIESDKTDEADLQRAVERAAALLRQHAVLDYTSRTCTETIPGHYVIYWELLAVQDGDKQSVDGGGDVLERCCLEMEEAMNSVYRQSRVADGSIGPLEIRIVRPGTFEELADYAVSHGASIGQYKVPRRVTAPPVIQLLDSRVVSSHFSPDLPHWAPAQMFNSTEAASG